MWWKSLLWPLPVFPTRRELETALEHDPAKLARLSASLWRMFRATVVGCVAGWLVCVAAYGWLLTAGVLTADELRGTWRLLAMTTAVFGLMPFYNYPWAFRHQGRRWVRWAVLAVGLPSLGLFVAGFFGVL